MDGGNASCGSQLNYVVQLVRPLATQMACGMSSAVADHVQYMCYIPSAFTGCYQYGIVNTFACSVSSRKFLNQRHNVEN